jgi:trimethylamine--corrinoid protein Co-methyltransferase
LLVEPNDITCNLRPLEITQALATFSDKPFMGSVAGAEGAKESIEIAKIVFGDISKKPVIIGLININSPLRLDSCMADAFIEYALAGQPILLTPGILMGLTAPVTIAGALVQAFAELIGCTVLTQIINKSTPVIIGLGGFGSDLRFGGTGFGRPEQALATFAGSQIARRLKIPFRCTAAVTSSRRPDCRSGYERMMTAMSAFTGGTHFCLQAAGILDSINTMNYEQFIIDIEIWSYIKRISKSIEVNNETLAMDVIGNTNSDYIYHEHTIKHMREQLHNPSLIVPESYESWLASDNKDVVSIASERVMELLDQYTACPFDRDIEKELEKYVNCRKNILAKV